MTDQVAENENIFENSSTEDKTVKQGDSSVKAESNTNTQPDINAIFSEQLNKIVNEKGERKYKDVFTALESITYKEDHIKTLEEELKSLREKATQDDTIEKALAKLSATKESGTTKSEEVFDAEKIERTVETVLTKKQQEQQKALNKSTVSSELVKMYGDKEKAKKAYEDKARELGMDLGSLISLAETSPKAVINLFSTTASSSSFRKESSVNTQSFQNKNEEVDYTSKYMKSENNSLDKWREVADK